eukprot:8817373-Pyramimonas_sp.AAC.1
MAVLRLPRCMLPDFPDHEILARGCGLYGLGWWGCATPGQISFVGAPAALPLGSWAGQPLDEPGRPFG